MSGKRGFDRLAGPYRLLELAAFGLALEKARRRHLEALRGRRRILVLGDGDGRFLRRLVRECPDARIESVDSSPKMLERASRRLSEAERVRVAFRCEDATATEWPENVYDAVVTLFFLDCFAEEQAAAIVARVARAATNDACWLWADFDLPPRGWRRLRARAWLSVLYAFFRLETGLSARRLPPSERLIRKEGFECVRSRSGNAGLLKSSLFRRQGRSPQSPQPTATPSR